MSEIQGFPTQPVRPRFIRQIAEFAEAPNKGSQLGINRELARQIVAVVDAFIPFDGFIRVDEKRPCWNCEVPTEWLEVNFEAPLHPGDCADAKWAEYAEALHRA